MSEILIYSPDERIVSRKDLVHTFSDLRWEVRVLTNMARPGLKTFDWSSFDFTGEGTLASGDIICGWRSGATHASECEIALTKRDSEQIERFMLNDELGVCIVHVTHPFDVSTAYTDSGRSLREDYGDDYLRHVQRATVEYTVFPKADYDFSLDLSKTIHRLRGGLWHDVGTGWEPVMYTAGMDAAATRWFNGYEEARALLEAEGGYLLPYRTEFLVTTREGVRELGLDPDDQDWARIQWDWMRPLDQGAWERLLERRLVAVWTLWTRGLTSA